MPDISELMAIATEKQKKKFSRGNRPDLLVNTNSLNGQSSPVTPPESVKQPILNVQPPPTTNIDNFAPANPERPSELGTNSAPIEHHKSINKAPGNSELSTSKASIEHHDIAKKTREFDHIKINKASDKHTTSINKAPGNSELGTNKASIEPQQIKETDLVQKLSINKASHEHQYQGIKAANSAPVKHQLSTNKASTKASTYMDLVGDERAFIDYIFSQLENSFSRETPRIPTSHLAQYFGKSSNRIRTLIQRLVEKSVLSITGSARGAAGWRRFSLPEEVVQEIKIQKSIEHQLSTNRAGDWASDRAPAMPYSSSFNSNLNKNNTNTEPDVQIPNFEDRLEIPQELFSTGIKTANVLALIKSEADLERVNESLQAYAFEYKMSGIVKTAIFYGAIRQGQYFNSDAYYSYKIKALKEQERANKKRAEAKAIVPIFELPEKLKFENEFNEKYGEEFAVDFLETMGEGEKGVLLSMCTKNGINYEPFKNALKNAYVAKKLKDQETKSDSQEIGEGSVN